MTKSIEPNDQTPAWAKTSTKVTLPQARETVNVPEGTTQTVDSVMTYPEVAPLAPTPAPGQSKYTLTPNTVTVCNGGSKYANLGSLTTYRVHVDVNGVEYIHKKGYGLVKLAHQNFNIVGRN